MKKIVSLILCAVMLACAFVVPAAAATVTDPALRTAVTKDLTAGKDDQGILYTLNDADKTAVVGLNTYADSNSSGYTGNGTVIIPEYVKANGTTYTVIAVGRNAFDTSAVKEVVIGNTVQTIGEMAFAGCEQLESVLMGSGVKTISGLAFWHCVKLVDAAIGKNVTTIGAAAFWSCVSLTDVTIPTACTTIGEKAFWNCSKLQYVNMLDHCPAVGADAFLGTTAKIGCSAGAKANFSALGMTVEEKGAYVAYPTVTAGANTAVTLRAIQQGDANYNGTIEAVAHTVTKAESVKVGAGNVSVVLCEHKNTVEVITLCAACEVAGSKNIVCADCFTVTGTEAIDAVEHNYQDIVTAPTCVDGGYTTHKCVLCRDKYQDSEVEALGHDRVSSYVITPSWTLAGSMQHVCQTCKRIDEEDLPMLGDVNGDGIQDIKDLVLYIQFRAGFTTAQNPNFVFIEAVANLNASKEEEPVIDIKDIVLLIQKLAKFEVEVG